MNRVEIAAAWVISLIVSGTNASAQSIIIGGPGSTYAGLGQYNLNTAQAGSINLDSAIRWNQYVSQSQSEADARYAGRQRTESLRINENRRRIENRVFSSPEPVDLANGDALNSRLGSLFRDDVSSSSLRSFTAEIPHEIIQEISFGFPREGMTLCMNNLKQKGRWPLALRARALAPDRSAIQRTIAIAVKETADGELQPETIRAVDDAIDNLCRAFVSLVPRDSPDYVPAKQYIIAMFDIPRMFHSPRMEDIIAELEHMREPTIGDLLVFMKLYHLQFAPAASPRQLMIYSDLYPLVSSLSIGGENPIRSARPRAAAAEQRSLDRASPTPDSIRSRGNPTIPPPPKPKPPELLEP